MEDLFREKSLQKLESTEQLDRMITIIKPGFWIVLFGSIAAICAMLAWSFWGRIPVCADGTGILTPSDHQAYTVLCYLPMESGKQIQPGMEVVISPIGENHEKDNRFAGRVVKVDSYVADREELHAQLGNETLVEYFLQNGPVVSVECQMNALESGSFAVGTLMNCSIVLERKAPASFLLPSAMKIRTIAPAEEGGF